jgi:Cof subfamily protein (haloacid dehalogenase superfamily)
MDLMMPGIGGTEAVRRLSCMEHPPRVLILSSYGQSVELARALSAGAKGALAKDAPMDELSKLYQSSKEHGVTIVTYKDDSIITENEEDQYVAIEAHINKMPVRKVDNFVAQITKPVTKCLMVGDGDYLAEVEQDMCKEYGDRLNVYRSEPFFLEIMPQNIDKAYSLSKLLNIIGLTKDEMIACGDGFNDLSMIKYAGLGVAMGNAQEVVKESANYVTTTNDENGVANVVNEFILS